MVCWTLRISIHVCFDGARRLSILTKPSGMRVEPFSWTRAIWKPEEAKSGVLSALVLVSGYDYVLTLRNAVSETEHCASEAAALQRHERNATYGAVGASAEAEALANA
eukprot:1039704-Pleurochrysis_carterae.AAC.2